jgi:hypothetical protein
MPILLVICGAAASVFRSLSDAGPRTFAIVDHRTAGRDPGQLDLVSEPINSRFRRLTEGMIPGQADQLCRRWRRFVVA